MTKTEVGLWVMGMGILGAIISTLLGVYARLAFVRVVFLALATFFIVGTVLAYLSLPARVRL